MPQEWLICKTKEGKLFYLNSLSTEYFWQHPLDISNKQIISQQKRSPNMPSVENESPSGRYLGEEQTPEDGFAGTFLEGSRMFSE